MPTPSLSPTENFKDGHYNTTDSRKGKDLSQSLNKRGETLSKKAAEIANICTSLPVEDEDEDDPGHGVHVLVRHFSKTTSVFFLLFLK